MSTTEADRNLEHMIRAIEPEGELVDLIELTGGVSSEMLLLRVKNRDRTFQVVARRPGSSADWKGDEETSAEREYLLARALRHRGLAVPEPLLLWSDGTEAPFFVMEHIHATTDVEEAHRDSAVRQMAAFLVALHDIDPGTAELPQLPRRENPVIDLPQFLTTSTALEVELRAALEGSTFQSRNPDTVLHGDYWPGNVLWSDGKLEAVIDWEDAALGDPLSDLACCRAELLCAYGRAATDLLTSSYLSASTVDSRDLDIWDAYVSFSALASMDSWGLEPAELEKRRAATRRFAEAAAQRIIERAREA